MKSRILISFLAACMPWLVMAQTDDLYFIPKKDAKVEKSSEAKVVPKKTTQTTIYAAPGSTVVVKDAAGKVRDVDEYNRRYSSRDYTFSAENDTLLISEKPYSERGEWVNGFEGSQDDYEYAMRIVRFRSPRYAIPVSSPLYWDVVYGVYPSWDWNVYDDGMYAYVFPTYSNPLWWDWRWTWGVAGPRWGWGWYSPWYYSSWYSPYWYVGWGGYWGGYWGFGWHHHHHGWGWAGTWRTGYSDYRPSRYTNYASSRRSGAYGNGRQVVGVGRQNNLNSSRRSSSLGRVVRPNAQNNNGVSVRPSGTSSIRRGEGTVTRPSRGGNSNYVRPSTTINRSGSSYNRPSSTRRSSSYGESNTRSRSTYTPQRSSGSSRSFSSGSMGGSSRSSGGMRSGGGGSSRRR
ncbi:hypothetical protein [uncultured Bacteroides sp.]|uniref:hypothetical protein n=1 Tax=uncultured Bacteroides sp. TaxID=162156 RepID=UPI002638D42E|nr:hypothetical protein [uncultured Bacteroides sp.]